MPRSILPLTRARAARIRALLRERRTREADGAFVIEGAKAVRDLLTGFPGLVRSIVSTPEYREREITDDRRVREAAAVPSYSCSEQAFATLSDLESPQGILAVVQQPVWNEEEVLRGTRILGVFGEKIQDPLNMGAIIRTAAALNATALWLTPDSVDRHNPKVVRATGGALLCLPVFSAPDVAAFARRGCVVYASEARRQGTVEMETIRSIPQRLLLAFGNEGQGLSDITRQSAVCRFTIPVNRRMESLNVAATVAIVLHYFGRLPRTT